MININDSLPYLRKLALVTLVVISIPCNGSNISEELRSYIGNIKSIAVEFEQTDSHDQAAKGTLIIDKPHKFRCNYYEPYPIVIVGNKNYVSVYDYEMENLSRIKAEENIFNFLLLNDVNLEEKFEVISAKSVGENYILRIKNNDLDKISEIWFDQKAKDIKKMQIFEEDNIITLTFGKTHRISNVAQDLFVMKDPDIYDKPQRLDQTSLYKRFTLVK